MPSKKKSSDNLFGYRGDSDETNIRCVGPSVWNILSKTFRNLPSLALFKRRFDPTFSIIISALFNQTVSIFWQYYLKLLVKHYILS